MVASGSSAHLHLIRRQELASSIATHEELKPESLVDFTSAVWSQRWVRPMPSPENVSGVVLAYVNCGRWLANCPVMGCGGAAAISKEDTIFLCVECGNASNDDQWYRVVLPLYADPIEKVLLRRPKAENRNWFPAEKLIDLEEENLLHGVK